MNGAWFCSEDCASREADVAVARAAARELVRTRALPRLKLGLLLVHAGAITPVQLREALDAQRQTGRRIGAELMARGVVEPAAVVKALAAQAGVPCLPNLDPSAARWCPEIGAQAVRALGLVPIGVDETLRHVKVACAAPVPRLALSALRELTGWSAEPFLVADATLDALVRAYGELADAPSHDRLVDRQAAGAAIAEAAAGQQDATVSQVSCDPYVWVRVSGATGMRDLFIPTGEEAAWQAAHTSL
jgi:type IV pilus assembly protein PilB